MKRTLKLLIVSALLSSFSGTLLARRSSPKNFRVKFNPFAATMRKRFEAAFDIKVAKRFSLGATGYYSQPLNTQVETGASSFRSNGFSRRNKSTFHWQTEGWGVGATANISLSREILKDGWTLRLIGSYNKAKPSYASYSRDLDLSLGGDGYFALETLFAYEWIYDFGLNINLGLGITKNFSEKVPFFPAAEFSMGFAV